LEKGCICTAASVAGSDRAITSNWFAVNRLRQRAGDQILYNKTVVLLLMCALPIAIEKIIIAFYG